MRDARAEVDAFVAVGSNIEPERNLVAALESLMALEEVVGCSRFYATPPLERPEQPWFANGVWQLRTSRPPVELQSDVLREIERRCGRERTEDRHAARVVDLDLVVYGDRSVDEGGLRVPDPEIERRAFLAVPLLELAPDLVLAGSKGALKELPAAKRAAELCLLEELTEKLKGMVEG